MKKNENKYVIVVCVTQGGDAYNSVFLTEDDSTGYREERQNQEARMLLMLHKTKENVNEN